MLIDSEKLKQDIATVMPSRIEVNLIVDAKPEAIVRCADCKAGIRLETASGKTIYMCDTTAKCHDGDWYCADGERR